VFSEEFCSKQLKMKNTLVILLLLSGFTVLGQEPLLTTGSRFPDFVITNISNAPVKEFYLNKERSNQFYILNFWGTWCSPCIPEMDALAKLQKQNAGRIQVIAISDDSKERKNQYLKNKPSGIWLATDTGYTLYKMLSLASVGQSAIVNPDKRIVAIVRTDFINQQMIDKILRGDTVRMSAGVKETRISTDELAFGVDSLATHNFSIRGYKKGQPSMGQRYLLPGPFKERRLTWYNVSLDLLYRQAFGIKTYKVQERYDSTVKEEEIHSHNFEDKQRLYCVDLLVKPEQKDSLFFILQQYLNACLPVKARIERSVINVYVLKRKPGTAIALTVSNADSSSYSFSGRGYTGTKIQIKDFAEDYLSNELGLPVVDETGITGYYNIKTNVVQRNKAGIIKSIEELGFVIEKAEREMPVIVYYKR